MQRFIRRRRASGTRDPQGQSLVEFALILPVFLVLFAAALDLGRLAAARLAVENAAREGSFQAAMTPTSYQAGQPCPTPDPGTGQTPDTNLVVCRTVLEAKGSGVSVSPSDVAMSCNPSCTPAMGSTATVAVTGHFTLLTPFMAAFLGGYNLNFSSSSTTQLGITPTPPPGLTPTPEPTPTPAPTPTPTPTPTPLSQCNLVSAGFTYTSTPSNNKTPVTVTVTDTTTYDSSCVTTWQWTWGDGTVTYGEVQAPHVYYNPGPGSKTYLLSLYVTSGAFYSRTGAYSIKVNP